MTTSILIIVSMLFLSAFFSGMEIAYISSNKVYIEIQKNQKGLIAKILDRLTRKPSKLITTFLIGNNIALVIYGIYMGELIVTLLTPAQSYDNSYVNYWLIGDGLILTQTVISTLIILITAEFLPKVFFQIYANSLLKAFAVPTYFFYALFNGISSFVMWISDNILKLFFKTEGDEVQQAFSKLELGNYISEQMETVEDHQQVDSEVLIFKNALEFSEIKTREVMIPRTEIIAVEHAITPQELQKKFTETGLSKILVYKEDIDDIVGYIHSFELLKRPNSIKSIIMPVTYVPETMLAKDVLNLLMKKRKSIAVVIDEYGGTSGMATLEDIVEELFGEIEDEHDSVVLTEEKLAEGRYKFSARLEIDYLNETYKLNFPRSENYETLAGLIVHYTEEIPAKNGRVDIEGYSFKILEASKTQIKLIEVQDLNYEDV
ncbi:MAG TPA: hemolysin family protein [Flavobacteriaceae bacterium]|nr:hemolysin family protein [Flavobacteriaceae bacterium]